MSSPFAYAAALAIDFETLGRRKDADSIAAETRIVIDQIEEQLAGEGLTLRDVIKTSCYLSDEAHRMEFIEAYQGAFSPGPYPARTTLVLGIAGDCRVQIEAIAERAAAA